MLLRTLRSLLRPPRADDERPSRPEEQAHELIKARRYEEAEALLADAASSGLPEATRLALLGELRYHQKRPEEAEELCLKAAALRPGLWQAHYVLSLVQYDAGRNVEALAQAHYARNLAPGEGRVLAQLGLALIANKDYGAARDVLRQAVLADPGNVPALNNLGIACHALMDYGDALYYFRRALSLRPDYAPAKENLRQLFGIESFDTAYDSEANALRSTLQPSEKTGTEGQEALSLEALESRYDEHPEDASLALALIKGYLKNLQLEAARDVLHLALAQHPEDVPLLRMAGHLYKTAGQLNKALASYEKALELDPDDVKSRLGLAEVLRSLDRHEDAFKHYEAAVAIQEDADTVIQLAFAQVNACRYEEALASCDRVEALRPEYAPFLTTSRAVCHAYLGHFDEAFKFLDLADRQESGNLSFAIFRGMIHLMQEDYAKGWDLYRYRKFSESKQMRLLPYPLWEGEPLEGKTLLVLAEQGLGDQVMFASCLPDVLALKPKEVLLEAHQRVARTLERSFPSIRVFPSDQRRFDWIPPSLTPDYYIPLADLPRFFRRRVEDFPQHQGYLRADPERVAHWRARLDALGHQPKVGFTWRGGLQQTRRVVRSLALEQLQPLLSDERLMFVNLQYGPVQAELQAYASARGLDIVDWPEAIADLDEFAALISALDLVITVCNTTVHYAGALNRPCWVMAPHVPEWRYGLRGEGMRWYPSVRIFRQPAAGDWDSVLTEVRKALAGR